ncbi:MaoC family dehydratase N-terminal domain-containing protein [Novosphingobium sp. Gsoil 351]|uniref:FAS1-like dehydratase domain-containing protein n=1 Tax=Novosphingobium sp. Gsoil 351 TaxID=2675225 RepID=UPI0012B501AE|nr:MaoC family dehydratase N-terminal domain-containing protein [Novosphingobium sp. Gsoil 351]QGN55035.1 MaoC family dehydratase [Novosphingobium sp. Gsoil 351]
MAETSGQDIRQGRFRREAKGAETASVCVKVERGRIRAFASVLGQIDPLFNDVAAAHAMGHPDIAAPPSFFMVVEAIANEELRRQGEASAIEMAGCDFRYLLHGDEHYSYNGLVYAGDSVTFSTRVLDFYDRKGGLMEFVTLESVVAHHERGPLIRARRTLLHKFG